MSYDILIICHRIPVPPNKGDKIRSFNYIRKLAEKNRIHLAFLIDDKADLHHLNMLERVADTVLFEVITPKAKKIISGITALLGFKPVSIPYFYEQELQSKIDRFLDGQSIDRVFCFSSPTAEYLYRSRHRNGLLQDIPWIMDLIDVDSHKWRQYAETSPSPWKWLYRREGELLLKYEMRIVGDFRQVLLVSEAEKRIFNQYVSTSNVHSVGNGVDLSYFAPGQGKRFQSEGPSLVFTGAMDYLPNIDGVTWFAQEIFPLIRQRIGGVQFYIVGSNAGASVTRLAEGDGIHVTGFVDDVRDYLATADICVVPLRIARGIQNKVLEAMAMGKALVCTPGAFDGIEGLPGRDLLMAEDKEQFAEAVISILLDRSFQERLGQQARLCMEQRYAWPVVLEKLDHLLTGEEE